MPGWDSYSFAFGPLLVFGALGVLIAILRWVTLPGGSLVERAPEPGEPEDYGVLVPVDAPESLLRAAQLQEELREIGIESTLAQTTRGLRVLVWPDHVDAARAVVRRLRGSTP